MAMEDVSMLSQLLRKDFDSVSELTKAFEDKRRPRIELMFETAARNAEVRRKEGPWQHWLKEHGIHAAMWVYWALGLDRFGLGQGPLAYDVEKDV
jgi:2-polyprenyl-6-methoxyphenol hydroxylase-like FAD-dependent oxidoreductase